MTHFANVACLVGLFAGCRPAIGRDWETQVDNDTVTAPLVSERFVVVGTSKAVVVLEPSGEPRCRLELGGKVFAPRAIDDERIVVGSGATVQALDARCTPLWRRATAERIASAPAVGDGVIVVPTVSGRLEAFAVDGTPKWTFAGSAPAAGFVGPPAIATPAAFSDGEVTIASGHAYVMDTSGNLFAIAVDTGQPRWSVGLADTAQATPLVTGEHIIVGADDSGVHALDAESHAPTWQLATENRVRAPALVFEDVVYIGSDDRHAYAIDAGTGSLRWAAETVGPIRARPAIYRNLVLFAGGYGDGRLYALQREDGSEFWRRKTGDGIVSDITVLGERLYAATVDGNVVAYRVWRTFNR